MSAASVSLKGVPCLKFLGRLVLCCTLFVMVCPAQTFSTLFYFAGANGANPMGSLVQGLDGNFYGTTFYGGPNEPCQNEGNGCGTVFKITPDGTLTTLHNFCTSNGCADGALPSGALVLGADGNFYGTTTQGGLGAGTIFKITPAGNLTTVHNFQAADGAFPQAGLILASDGNFYGTAEDGGANQAGTVFKFTPDGTLTVLYSFCGQSGCTDGRMPVGGLVQANDGNLYGTTMDGGVGLPNFGTVFRVTLGGSLTTLHSFNGDDGGNSRASLIQATDGNLYGTTSWGGSGGGYGTVFKTTLDGNLTTLYGFSGPDGADPYAPLVQGTDGNFYGTTWWGGSNFEGTLFKITPSGRLTTLHNFNTVDGSWISAGLIQATNGYFYGAASAATNCYPVCGTVFNLTVGLAPFIETQPNSGSAGTPVTILGTNLSGATGVTFNGTSATFTVQSPTTIVATVPSGATSGLVQVTVPSGSLNSNTDFQVMGPLQLVPVSPCRLVDTRQSGGPIEGGTSRNFTLPSLGGCGIPSNAGAYSLNVTVVPHGRLGYLTVWPQGEIQPAVSTMNSPDGRVKANAAIVPAANNAVSVYASDTTDVILDINGYLAPPSAQTYQFYPVTPCRIVDTRNGQDGGTLQAGVERDYPIAGNCGVPPEAIAYSFNVTVLPTQGSLDYLTVWPQGETMPVVSTLNDNTGTVVANAAIVPAGAHNTTAFYAHNLDTDLLVDIDGYFAAPGTGGLSLYPTAPCRVLDTRQNNGQPFQGERTVNVVGSLCEPPSAAKAYVLNATVVPPGAMNYLTLWPNGEGQPTVSTLNARDGSITSNMAIVPTNDGSIDAYAAGLTQLILDISGYFAP